jgi:hypothetical protein
LYADNNNITKKQISEIIVASSHQIDFLFMPFIPDYIFEKQQNVRFKINKEISDSHQVYNVDTTIGNIMGSRGQFLVKKYKNIEELRIKASHLKNYSLNMNFQLENLKKLDGEIFLYFKRHIDNNDYVPLYKSEIQPMSPSIKFENISIPLISLGNPDSELVIEIFQFYIPNCLYIEVPACEYSKYTT